MSSLRSKPKLDFVCRSFLFHLIAADARFSRCEFCDSANDAGFRQQSHQRLPASRHRSPRGRAPEGALQPLSPRAGAGQRPAALFQPHGGKEEAGD